LGLLREEKCFAAEILQERGLQLSNIRVELDHTKHDSFTQFSPVAPPQAIVTINSTPAGADLEVDGEFLGNTPSVVPLAVGERMIRLTKKGFQSWERKLRVLSGGKQTIVADLEQLSS